MLDRPRRTRLRRFRKLIPNALTLTEDTSTDRILLTLRQTPTKTAHQLVYTSAMQQAEENPLSTLLILQTSLPAAVKTEVWIARRAAIAFEEPLGTVGWISFPSSSRPQQVSVWMLWEECAESLWKVFLVERTWQSSANYRLVECEALRSSGREVRARVCLVKFQNYKSSFKLFQARCCCLWTRPTSTLSPDVILCGWLGSQHQLTN